MKNSTSPAPPVRARFASRTDLPTQWGGEPGRPPHTVGRRGRKSGQAGEWGSCFWVGGCDSGRGSACLSLGRGSQRGKTLATICCVPVAVITPNVGAVKTFG